MVHKEYKKKIGLCIIWQTWDIVNQGKATRRFDRSVRNISAVLELGYGFEMQTYRIPLLDSFQAFKGFYTEWIKLHSDPDTLLVVCYSGHGGYHQVRGLLWGGTGDNDR